MRAVLVAADRDLTGKAFNVGTGNPVSVNRIVELLGAAETAGENPSQNSNDTQAKTNKDDSAKDKNREIFRPSEEISEDFAVSFPVDI